MKTIQNWDKYLKYPALSKNLKPGLGLNSVMTSMPNTTTELASSRHVCLQRIEKTVQIHSQVKNSHVKKRLNIYLTHKNCQNIFVIREMQIQSKMRYHYKYT